MAPRPPAAQDRGRAQPGGGLRGRGRRARRSRLQKQCSREWAHARISRHQTHGRNRYTLRTRSSRSHHPWWGVRARGITDSGTAGANAGGSTRERPATAGGLFYERLPAPPSASAGPRDCSDRKWRLPTSHQRATAARPAAGRPQRRKMEAPAAVRPAAARAHMRLLSSSPR